MGRLSSFFPRLSSFYFMIAWNGSNVKFWVEIYLVRLIEWPWKITIFHWKISFWTVFRRLFCVFRRFFPEKFGIYFLSSGSIHICGTKIYQKMIFKYFSSKNSKKSAIFYVMRDQQDFAGPQLEIWVWATNMPSKYLHKITKKASWAL